MYMQKDEDGTTVAMGDGKIDADGILQVDVIPFGGVVTVVVTPPHSNVCGEDTFTFIPQCSE